MGRALLGRFSLNRCPVFTRQYLLVHRHIHICVYIYMKEINIDINKQQMFLSQINSQYKVIL